MTLKRVNPAQLRFRLDLDENHDDAVERAITAEEAQVISEIARVRFTEGDKPGWFDDYLRYLDYGWPWRVAAYIAWASTPKTGRAPKTLDKLAELLGLTSPRAIHNWRNKYPSIDAIVSLEQAAPLWEHRRDMIDALVASATDRGYKGYHDRKLAFEMMGDYISKSRIKIEDDRAVKDERSMDDEALRALAMADDDDIAGKDDGAVDDGDSSGGEDGGNE